ncbi:fibronectin type III domain-containing protein [Candidatus Peribacteria bacterium]|nr:fibronectin type III domain-containing protein [Candidatus Peribacteria bacterium]
MNLRQQCIHRHICRSISVVVSLGLAMPATVYAAEADATFSLHPHCIEREGETDDWIFGPIPSPGIVVETRQASTRCTSFDVKDPQTLQTPALSIGDTLDIDVVIDNPSAQHIKRARAWLSYDPNMLEGVSIDINETFSLVTPDERAFSESEGYVKMEASAEDSGPNTKKVLFARLTFRVIETNPIGTPITFHDAQPSGHTVIMTAQGDEEAYIQKEEPGVLLVRFATENILDDGSCVRDEDCEEHVCIAGVCQEPPAPPTPTPTPTPTPVPTPTPLLPNGAVCSENSECQSTICSTGICVPQVDPTPPIAQTSDRTTFSLLQIRNVRVTTDGTSVFLAWDPLQSSLLKAYNIYYGTTSGRYIQRRTIDKSETSITIRSLPLGTRYYFAVRGLSSQNEESAFSNEVSLVIGEPNTSTAPLTLGSMSGGPARNPVASTTTVPGETGAPSILLLFLLGSAVIGTSFASRRQFSVTTKPPDHG